MWVLLFLLFLFAHCLLEVKIYLVYDVYDSGFWLRFMMGMMVVSLHTTNTNVNGSNKVWRGVCVFFGRFPSYFLAVSF